MFWIRYFDKYQYQRKSDKYNCCNYSSSCADHLVTHLGTHTGENPFKCYQCSSQLQSLNINIKTVIGACLCYSFALNTVGAPRQLQFILRPICVIVLLRRSSGAPCVLECKTWALKTRSFKCTKNLQMCWMHCFINLTYLQCIFKWLA